MVSRKQRGRGSESSKHVPKTVVSRKEKPKPRTVYDYMDLPEDKLTPQEKKHLAEWKAKNEALEKSFTGRCKVCDKHIPEGWEYCGSEHIRIGEGEIEEQPRKEKGNRTLKDHGKT